MRDLSLDGTLKFMNAKMREEMRILWACRLEASPSGHSLQVLASFVGCGLSAAVPHANTDLVKFDNMSLKERFGPIPEETGFKRRMRLHQGWWRMNILDLPPGEHPKLKDQLVCNTIPISNAGGLNFLNTQAREAVERTLESRKTGGAGLMEEVRLKHNLLSSQPLCFNFFGPLMTDLVLGEQIVRSLWPDVEALHAVHFEHAPSHGKRPDNSAFDVALEVTVKGQRGLIGLECKYTDTFSAEEYDKPAYRALFEGSSYFKAAYDQFKSTRYNQLFRGQLLAERLIREGHYSFVRTGLFCHELDAPAIQIGHDFQNMLNNGTQNFSVTTFADFISASQRIDITWEQRQWQ